ncbi:MAG: Asr1405/Asl0597 family protein [Microcystis sp.]|jgi:hypothetical protein|uniref:Uncharacterized protein n=7 Tax=Microcystis TaxID=1125 RepID=A0A841UY05_MICAE|nr:MULTISPECIES: Asr1405/Asl0597 family protein [Microcystis]MBE5229423.1 hypothetical protein [Microcystis aeruginosa PMC 728.11]MCA2553389.1 hypothetical protein [Microcystis sp. M04BS1]MDY7050918.1 hypothetical protein [Microcystis panniformis WG22]NCR53381.1 hypothetical protein [Microcystis aeruginosa L211-07]NCR70958.1 hypothetical protein [Microcystis aeruginosa LG13-12]NCS23338.1 hypothetical protein [Microcystis aeruginosa BS13-02]NCS28994.1 hypothetical protein [Microcystis aerugin
MNSPPEKLLYSPPLSSGERREVYYRLLSLGICCQCPMYSPLTVQIESPYDLVQLLGVLRSLHCSRGELIQLLKDCWRLEVSGVDH